MGATGQGDPDADKGGNLFTPFLSAFKSADGSFEVPKDKAPR